MYFDYNLPIYSVLLFSAALLSLIFILTFYSLRLLAVRRCRRQCDDVPADGQSASLPKVSVVMYSRNEAESLAKSLPAVLEQEYAGEFEVIVVNDGTANESDTLVTGLKAKYPNLYLTFAPENSRNVSRKKLAVTLGVKAAKGDVIIVTDASVQVPSAHWLQRMASHFTDPNIEVVLGYSSLNLKQGRWRGRQLTIFDSVADSVAWLSSAIKGTPYRGDGGNIAYRRDLFFRNKGFSTSLHLRDGDDDLFVNEIANGSNTVVELGADAITCCGRSRGARKRYKGFRRSHAFTGRTLPKASRRVMALGEWLMWLVPICSLAGAYLAGVNNLFGWVLAAVLILSLYISVVIIWRRTIASLTGYRLGVWLPWLAALRPLRNVKCNLSSGSRFNATYTWQDPNGLR